MTKRNLPNHIHTLDDLTRIDEIVLDKRNGKRSRSKVGRRARHVKKQFIKNALTSLLDTQQSNNESLT